MRSVEEWVGKTDDAKIPDRVRVRVFEKYNGVCYLSGAKIMPGDKWECDHIIALANGGRHAEANLAPILCTPHREKTKDDRRTQSRIYRIKKRHLGLTGSKSRPIPGSKASRWKRKLNGTWERR